MEGPGCGMTCYAGYYLQEVLLLKLNPPLSLPCRFRRTLNPKPIAIKGASGTDFHEHKSLKKHRERLSLSSKTAGISVKGT